MNYANIECSQQKRFLKETVIQHKMSYVKGLGDE